MIKYLSPVILFPLIMVGAFYFGGIYQYIWRFATLNELKPIFKSTLIGFHKHISFEALRRYVTSFYTTFSVAATASLVE